MTSGQAVGGAIPGSLLCYVLDTVEDFFSAEPVGFHPLDQPADHSFRFYVLTSSRLSVDIVARITCFFNWRSIQLLRAVFVIFGTYYVRK